MTLAVVAMGFASLFGACVAVYGFVSAYLIYAVHVGFGGQLGDGGRVGVVAALVIACMGSGMAYTFFPFTITVLP